MSTEAALTHHLQAIGQGIDPIMSDYTDESVLFTPDGPIKGLAGIRAFFTALLDNSPPELVRALAVTRQDFEGEVAYILWQAMPFIPFAADTFVIRDGKILYPSLAMPALNSSGV
jgi:ketosteroid isomerase-like protein